jgi:predicted dehydrogenase
MRAAVIGCGRIGAQPSARAEADLPPGWCPISHIEALIQTGRFTQIALCDSNPDALEKWGRHYGIEDRFSDYRDLFESFQPDVATVATRTPAKKAIVDCLCESRTKGLYLEKPMANSIAGARSLVSNLEAARVKFGYGVNRRYHSFYRQAKTLIETGAIGNLLEISIELGSSQLLWTHPHSVDLILFFAGASADEFTVQASLDPASLVMSSERTVDSDPVIEHAHFRLSNGVTANITRGRGLNVRMCGSHGSLTVHANGSAMELHTKSQPASPYFLESKSIRPDPGRGATVNALTELADSVVADAPSPIDFNSAIGGLEMLLGCVWSHLNDGRRISNSHIPLDLTVMGKTGANYA